LLVPNMQLDLGGIAKGFAADQALETLRSHGVTRALVAASGDIAVGEAPPGKRGWRVSIGSPVSGPTPKAGALSAQTLLLKNAAVSTSGDAEQFVEIDGVRYSHIVDPRTGMGLTNQLQVTIVARRATDTDAFATTVCVLGIERGLRLVESQPGMAALILRKDDGRLESVASRRMKKFPLAE
jgi:thiamine biosynthesis lipoprotein